MISSMRDPVHEVARAVASLDARALTGHARESVRRLVLDSLAVGLAGRACEDARLLEGLVAEWGGAAQATILGTRLRVPAPAAALVNGTAIQALDFDDTHDASAAHTASTVLPAALAAAELRGRSGADVVAAVCAGVEVVGRIGLACADNLGFTSTSVYGAFGAAAAAARALGLDAQRTRHALGIVLSQASGTTQTALDKPLSKHMQSGFAAQAGVQAALLAERGATGVENVFEGRYGFFRLHKGGRYRLDPVVAPWRAEFQVELLSLKPYPSCRATHGPAQAALALAEQERFAPAEIDAVTVVVPAMSHELAGRPFEEGPNPVISAQFSIAYAIAAALARGRLALADFTPAAIADPAVRALAARVAVERGAGGDFTPARVEVRLRSGRVQAHTVTRLLGSPESPMDARAMHAKLEDCLGFAPPGTGVTPESLVRAVDALEEAPDAGAWLHRLGGARAPSAPGPAFARIP